MSDSNTVPASKSQALAEFNKKLEEDKNLDKRKKELQEKKFLVDSYKYDNELAKITKNEADIERLKNINVGVLDDEKIAKIQQDNRNYLANLNDSLVFLDTILSKLVTAWPGNLILVGSKTGGGKSSLTGNLIFTTILQKNPKTGKNRKVLVISNEESAFSVYNRLTCLVKGWNYSDQDDFTEEQKETLVEFAGKWARLGVTVIEDDGHGLATSLEGICSIFDNLIKNEVYYDMVVLDYIQKCTSSKRANMQAWEVMKKTMEALDGYKNVYPGTLVVTSQLASQTNDGNDNERDFQDRIRGGKDILNPCTMGIELVPIREQLKSRFIIRKSRYRGELVGHSRDMGFKNGRFVPYTDDFQKEVAARNEKKEWQETVGKHLDDKKEEKQETKE
jgi:replicative DNA helicase